MAVVNIAVSRLGAFKVGGLALGLVAVGLALAGLPHQARAADQQSDVARFVAEGEIREKIAEFSFLADGDGQNPRDIKALADNLYAPEFTLNGKVFTRDQLYAQSMAHPTDPTLITRHMMISTAFDEITPTSAKTRTIALYIQVTKNQIGPDCKKAVHDPEACGGRVVRSAPYVYRETWAKTAEGWRKTASVEIIQ